MSPRLADPQLALQRDDFTVAQGVAISRDVSGVIGRRFLAVDNPGTYWIHFPQIPGALAWVPPTTFGWVAPLPYPPPGQLQVNTIDLPVGYTLDNTNLTADASITVFAEFPNISLGVQQLITTKIPTVGTTLTLTGPPSGTQTVLLVDPGSGYVGLLADLQSGGTSRFSVDSSGVVSASTIQFDPPGTAHQIQLFSTAGIDGRRLNIASGDAPAPAATGSAELQLVPANTAPLASMRSQIQILGVAGTNLERLDISAVSNSYVIDTTANGAGVVRPIVFMAQSAPNAVAEQNAMVIQADGSVQLRGDFFTDANGVNFGANRTTIADFTNRGTSYLLFDTRTTTPANNAADVTGLRLRRGGAEKWVVGLNIDGANTDNFNVVAVGGGNQDITFQPAGTGLVNFAYALNPLGGGAAPTFGTIGGTGPTAAAQNSWLKVKVNGVASFIPLWR